ncbi:hypothetical protein GCM10010168_70710 [Actinoplanes ianthinogenes]|uniref:Secreted protein n=1 Tax=Actinoplanes ianthinogenes TaxID=122358 RepID=A0ABN6CQ44_9ACTN|nr:hypothetical protein Aiant_79970 [Actinoplanes ianthinogenes]GGR41928.1 hypothetical protein GCM10010168_70710 [Actinoplanes ianthinogenes]
MAGPSGALPVGVVVLPVAVTFRVVTLFGRLVVTSGSGAVEAEGAVVTVVTTVSAPCGVPGFFSRESATPATTASITRAHRSATNQPRLTDLSFLVEPAFGALYGGRGRRSTTRTGVWHEAGIDTFASSQWRPSMVRITLGALPLPSIPGLE